ncbi:hypothetical protein KP509_29G055200 [Ceratopteris richardii]|uniref:Uncharacterized protein n=1 Tax=Ceratopteris richardii TaxID=49495 RepID=A0A8T2R8V4_CERRI|nr:hypothetical protein KP509_29G055200 [Ceratopteris richardii]
MFHLHFLLWDTHGRRLVLMYKEIRLRILVHSFATMKGMLLHQSGYNSCSQSFPSIRLVPSTSHRIEPSLTSPQLSLHLSPFHRACPIIPSSPKPRKTTAIISSP